MLTFCQVNVLNAYDDDDDDYSNSIYVVATKINSAVL